ncbi:MAG TPA: acetate--CoA ligase family protein [Alphaproteobacteria bacterium]
MFRSPAPIFKAKSIAIVGASDRARWPATIWSNLKEGGYPGKVYPVNPRRETVWGVPCYPDFGSLPEPAELALVIVPASAVLDVVADGVAHGLRGATVYAANIGEGIDPEIVARGERLRALCAEAGVALAGPNCMGSMAVREKLFSYPNRALGRRPPGPVAAVFQSGGTLQFWAATALARGMRFSYAVSSGNELGLDLADYVNFFVDDPETRTIVLFIEGIRRAAAFKAACARALVAKKPVIAIKTGRTPRALEAARSHTGAIGGDWAAYEALCERYGIVDCPTLDDLTETALAFQQGRLPRGPRIGVVTTSGGTVDLLYDYAADEGAVMPDFAAGTVRRIRPHIPEEMTPQNPLDSGIPAGNETLAATCEAVLDDPSVDMLAVAGQIASGRARLDDAGPLKALLDYSDKPIIGFGRMRYMMGEDGIAYQDHVGIPFLQGLPETLRALNGLAFYAARAGRAPQLPPAPNGTVKDIDDRGLEALLASKGVGLPRSARAATGAEAAEAAAAIGFPVALKVLAPAFSHKTEVGGVLLGLAGAAEVAAGAETLRARIAAADPRAEIEGFLVQEMVTGVEMIVGCREDPIYGPAVLVGAGGILAELVRDAAMRLLPVTEADVRAMIAGLRVRRLLEGFRGAGPADTDALVRAVLGLAEVFLEHRRALSDLEVNPLVVRAAGEGVAAVDIRPVRGAG